MLKTYKAISVIIITFLLDGVVFTAQGKGKVSSQGKNKVTAHSRKKVTAEESGKTSFEDYRAATRLWISNPKWDMDFTALGVVAQSDDKYEYSVIDTLGNEVVVAEYDYIGNFSNGIAEVKTNDKYGLINRQGIEILPCHYSYIFSFSEGVGVVKYNDKY